ncbi:MAG: DsrE family protein [Gammaproteobacteria bacterium]
MAQLKAHCLCTPCPRHGLKALLAAFLGLVLLAAALPRDAAAHQDEGIVKVVYHADFADPRRFSAMLTSINNMVTTYKNDLIEYDIRIVFVAHGVRFVTDDKLADTPFVEDPALAERRDNLKGRLLSLHEVHGVGLELCDITRSQIQLPEDKVYKGVEMVTSGVVRIAELQRDNFAYIKIE